MFLRYGSTAHTTCPNQKPFIVSFILPCNTEPRYRQVADEADKVKTKLKKLKIMNVTLYEITTPVAVLNIYHI